MRCERIYLKDYYDFLDEDGCNAYVDFYLPYNMTEMNRENQKRPCMIVCPGGAYAFCSQRESEPIAVQFLPLGFNVFVINYSVSPHRFPQQLLEVAALFELIYKNADKWNCDTEKIGIMGFSAGGHLAAHYSNSFACDEVREIFPESKRPFASVLCYPVISADEAVTHRGSIENLVGYFPKDSANDKFSCEKLVNENTPQAFIWHTAEDGAVPVENSLLYALKLAKYKIPYEFHIYPYGNHGLSTADSESCGKLDNRVSHVNTWLDSLKSWIKLTF